MKIIKKDPTKAEEQKAKKEIRAIENRLRTEYLENLSKDAKFKRYVIEEIINQEIKNHTSIGDNIQEMVRLTPEEVKAMLIAKTGALKAVKIIKNKLCNF
jgi:hypothetical protein